ncbi:hypothetical protein LCGC14_0221680 [marine sediment metagenome]|uniref:Methyltransferase type 11 domain-containing protein n=1 Tax=marine sediment metagenome TaxID=412755 RepID=A0A0F9UDQ2_9ZZZZ
MAKRNDNTLDWWNKRYSIADVHKIWSSKKRLQFYDMIATAIPRISATILDVGSGFGFGPAHLMNIYSGWDIEGLDFSTKACAEAVIQTYCVNIITDNIPDKYDYIISAETMEHFSDPMTVLAKMYKAATKAVILTVPYMGGISEIHITSFDIHTFNKYSNVQVTLSDNKHFMLVVIPKLFETSDSET